MFPSFKNRIDSAEQEFDNWLSELTSRPGFYWILFTIIISLFLTFENAFSSFITEADRYFNNNFIEWFGVFYGFLIPTVLVKVWEQFDLTGREFDREADVVRILIGDVQLLDNQFYSRFKIRILTTLQEYITHVATHFDEEHKSNVRFKTIGDDLLRQIRTEYSEYHILHPSRESEKEAFPLVSELIEQLNSLIDIRGDRIALSKQRLFQGLRYIVLASSVIWLLPFYFIAEPTGSGYGLYTNFVILLVTVLVVFVLSIIEDLDEPFGGTWRIGNESWIQVSEELSRILDNVRKETSQKRTAKKKSARKIQK